MSEARKVQPVPQDAVTVATYFQKYAAVLPRGFLDTVVDRLVMQTAIANANDTGCKTEAAWKKMRGSEPVIDAVRQVMSSPELAATYIPLAEQECREHLTDALAALEPKTRTRKVKEGAGAEKFLLKAK